MIQKKVKFIVIVSLFFFHATPKSFALGVDFTERACFNEDGSGLFSLKVDLTKSSRLISAIKYLNKDYEGITKLIGLNSFFRAKKEFKKMSGIHDVRVQHDDKMLKFTLRFEFDNIQTLNNAVYKINQGMDPTGITYFSLSDEVFVRRGYAWNRKKTNPLSKTRY